MVALEVLESDTGSNWGQIGLLEVKKGLQNCQQNMQFQLLISLLFSTNYSMAIKPEQFRLLIYQQEQ